MGIFIYDGINSLAKLNIYSMIWSNFVLNLHEDQKLKKKSMEQKNRFRLFSFWEKWESLFSPNELGLF